MFAILIYTCITSIVAAGPYYDLAKAAEQFEEYTKEYGKQYANEQEKQFRFEIFKQNLIEVNRINVENSLRSSGPVADFGITQFMDLTLEEFREGYTGLGRNYSLYDSACRVLTDRDIPEVNAPKEFDWRDRKVVSRVKNQGRCESCYTFSTTGHLESQYAIKHKQLLELSEQQIIDCDRRSRGCQRGYMSWAFQSIMELGGIMREADYPYRARDGYCQFNRNGVALRVRGCFTYKLRSQEKLKQLLYQTGPISIAVKADYLQKYRGGVVPDRYCQQGSINHAVLLVGYGTDPQQGPFWIIKNSYARTFGEQGYFRVQRGERALSCGLMNEYMASAVIE